MSKRLTPRQAKFAKAFTYSANASEAARQAGYEPRFARQAAHVLLGKPHVVKEVERLRLEAARNIREFALANAELATTTLVGLMSGEIEAPAAVRRLAALDLLALAGANHEQLKQTTDQIPVEEMTIEQLNQFIAEGMETLKKQGIQTIEADYQELP